MISDDFRKIALLDWLENDLLLRVIKCEPASSDASFRRYFRITLTDRQLVVMDAPPDKENIPQFIKVAEMLRLSEVNVPIIYQQNLADGFLLIEDFGTQSFLDKLTSANVSELYGNALNSLIKLQTHSSIANGDDLPHYDEALLKRELGVFEEWFINKALNIEIPSALWGATCNILINSALEQPKTFVHRDFHSRNIMVLQDNTPGIIDFQDAVIGPITYDLVSLLRDCYITWPKRQVDEWMSAQHQKLLDAGLITCAFDTFARWFDLMGMQRHLKAIGIFSRLNIRDNKSGYLNDIPRTLNYIMELEPLYPEFAGFHAFLKNNLPSQYLLSP